jgi:hypothetical protein
MILRLTTANKVMQRNIMNCLVISEQQHLVAVC